MDRCVVLFPFRMVGKTAYALECAEKSIGRWIAVPSGGLLGFGSGVN